jgi:hypothetical protein
VKIIKIHTYKISNNITIGCFEDGIDYHGGDLDGRTVKIVSSSEECQKECQSNVDCNYWTWITPDSQEVKNFVTLKREWEEDTPNLTEDKQFPDQNIVQVSLIV